MRSSNQLAAAGVCLACLVIASAAVAFSAEARPGRSRAHLEAATGALAATVFFTGTRTGRSAPYRVTPSAGRPGLVVVAASGEEATPPELCATDSAAGRKQSDREARMPGCVGPEPGASAHSSDRAAIAPANAEPVEVVERLHATLLDVMQHASTLGYQGRYQRLEPVLRRTLDLDFMGSKAAGRHWREFSADEQSRWLDAFSRMTLANYAGRFNGYSGQHFETLGSEAAPHDTILVRTRLTGGEEDVQLNYRLRKTATGWRVIDIYMHGTVSELALRRAEYSTAIERDGLDKVVADVEAKIHDLESGKSS